MYSQPFIITKQTDLCINNNDKWIGLFSGLIGIMHPDWLFLASFCILYASVGESNVLQ